ncbi:flavohemoprotein [Coleophoma crateriformis]|uniref:nitric oxide dioxygenase n=1 Tax=Coleophoma crateriformis TaxID=565419 RepID=A0A3D8QUL2_9HELO|nr:flavohemoprotein [Coleophoma crateriformis]
MSLSEEQISIIKATVPVLAEHGNTITTEFYQTMLDENPELYNIFNKTKQVNGHQPRALAGALYAYATNIDNLGALGGALENITQKHASLFVTPEQYDIVGKYLLEAMGRVLGEALTPAVLEAWTQAYKLLAGVMIEQERKLYAAHAEWADWKEFEVSKKVPESEEVTSFYLKPVDGRPLPMYRPGQYISVRAHVPNFSYLQARQYSLSDAHLGSVYRLSVKRDDGLHIAEGATTTQAGLVSNMLHGLNVGDRVQVSHPHGDFYLSQAAIDQSLPVVLISAGVGVTPLMSMLNYLVNSGSSQPISWIHGARRSTSQAFNNHVRDICKTHSNVHCTVFLKNPSDKDVLGETYQHAGRVSLAALDKEKDLFLGTEAEYYICGPESFMADIKRDLIENGVVESRINLESFGAA